MEYYLAGNYNRALGRSNTIEGDVDLETDVRASLFTFGSNFLSLGPKLIHFRPKFLEFRA